MVKVSVIIPVYNVEKYLRQCLDSVVNQTLKDIEIICIDDASPDNCPRILDEYGQKDTRMRVFHLTKNQKQGHGRNLGLSEAGGKYVYFLDADDCIKPDAMKTLYEAAERESLDGVFFDSEEVYETERLRKIYEGTAVSQRTGIYPSGVVDGQKLAQTFLENHEWSVLVQRQFWRRQYLQENDIVYPEGAEHEDQFFTMASSLMAKRVKYLRAQLLIRRFREQSVVTSDPAPKNFHGYLVNAWSLLSFVRKNHISGEPAETMIRDLFRSMKRLYPVFRDEEDTDAWLKDSHLEQIYSFYHYAIETDEWQQELDRRLFQPLTEYRSIVIYGAGRVGKSVFKRLFNIDMIPERFLVTCREGNPELLFGAEVEELSDYRPKPDEIIVVAMASGMHEEVSGLLREKKLTHYLYAKDKLTGPIINN